MANVCGCGQLLNQGAISLALVMSELLTGYWVSFGGVLPCRSVFTQVLQADVLLIRGQGSQERLPSSDISGIKQRNTPSDFIKSTAVLKNTYTYTLILAHTGAHII